MSKRNIKVGDTIKFSTIHRYGKTIATRKVVDVHPSFGIGVRFNGWNPYYLYSSALDKIIKVTKAAKKKKD